MRCRRSRSPNILPITLNRRRQVKHGHEALARTPINFASSWRRVFRWRWARMWGHFRTVPRRREYVLMVKYGMSPLAALQAGLLNGAKVLGWQGQTGDLKAHYLADIVAVEGNPIEDINAVEKVAFVMKGGTIFKKPGE